jgi:hypothetical protein
MHLNDKTVSELAENNIFFGQKPYELRLWCNNYFLSSLLIGKYFHFYFLL